MHLDLPEDVAQAAAVETRGAPTTPALLPDLSNEVAAAIRQALQSSKRPLLICGLSFTRCAAGRNLLQFIERQNIPFVTTLHGKGFLPESHANSAGVIGRARRSDVKKFTDRADLVIAVGYDPIEINYEDWVKPGTPVVHISTEAAENGNGLNLLLEQGVQPGRGDSTLSAALRPQPMTGR